MATETEVVEKTTEQVTDEGGEPEVKTDEKPDDAALKEKMQSLGMIPKPVTEETTDGDETTVVEEEKPEEKVEEEETLPPLDEELLSEAEELGIPRSISEGMETDEHVAELIRVVRKAGEKPAAEGERKVEAEKEKPKERKPITIEDLGLSANEDDPRVIGAFTKLTQRVETEIDEMRKGFEGVGAIVQTMAEKAKAEADARYYDDFDKAVVGLGAEFEEVLGKGKRDELDESGEPFQRRVEILRAMDDIADGRARRKEKPLPFDTLFKRGLHSVIGEDTERITRKKVSGKLTKREKLLTARPTHRKEPPAPATQEEKERKVQEKLNEIEATP